MSPTLPRLARAATVATLMGGAAAGLAGCPASAEQVAPPRYDLYFPTGLALSPDERYLFVVNANSDLRYSAGALQVIDIDAVDALAAAWNGGSGSASPSCGPIATRPKVLSCKTTGSDGGPASGMADSVQIGSFGVAVAVQPLTDGGAPSSTIRVYTTVRGDPSITWAQFDPGAAQLDCGGSGGFPRCDEPHRLVRMRNDAALPSLAAEPFDIAIDPVNQRGYVSDLTSGIVSLLSAPSDIATPPRLEDALGSLWSVSFLTGTLGAVGVAPRVIGDPRGLVYVTSRAEARVALVHAVDGALDATGHPTAQLVRTTSFYMNGIATSGDGGDARGVAFTADGNRAFMVTRTPPALQVFDTSLDARGAPRNQPLGTAELCAQPSNLALADFGEGLRVALPCFATGQVWIVDADSLELVGVEDSGRGPSGVAASARHHKIYVGNYAEDTLTVIDATPGAATQNRAVLRLGTERVANPS